MMSTTVGSERVEVFILEMFMFWVVVGVVKIISVYLMIADMILILVVQYMVSFWFDFWEYSLMLYWNLTSVYDIINVVMYSSLPTILSDKDFLQLNNLWSRMTILEGLCEVQPIRELQINYVQVVLPVRWSQDVKCLNYMCIIMWSILPGLLCDNSVFVHSFCLFIDSASTYL